jgi:hypothetical protein
MDIFCPTCKSKTEELIECANCGSIGCPKCIRKKYGKWVCHKCPEPEYEEKKYYYRDQEDKKPEEEVSSAFASMFG